ncbi:hypothetical protein AEM51_00345 [Bacteroidetes bacterium UKL13-3]|nr:hypothetical protein AEM51_00345 [Bacteroidetes bacterium UKL13-3]
MNGNKPSDSDVQTKYETDYRVIVWNDPLIKDYKYSNEAFDKLGYEFVKKNEGDNYQRSKIYRSCSKGIIVEVTEWYNVKLSISLQWYQPSVRKSIGYLMYCDMKKQTNEEINKDLYNSFKADDIKKFKTTTVDYSDRKNKPILIEGNTFLKEIYYGLIQKKCEFTSECLQIILNKDGTKEFKTNWQKEIGDKATDYKTYTAFIKNELPKLIFSNPKENVWGDSIAPTTRINAKILYQLKFSGTIKVAYDSKSSTVTIKSKDTPSEIKTEDLVQFFKDKKDGTYKLSFYSVTMALDNCYNADNYFTKTTFIGYKEYEKGDEYKTY